MKTLLASLTSMIKNPIFEKIIIIAMTVAAALVLFVPTISRAFITHYALKTAKDVLQMEVTISSAELHLLSGSVRINDLAIYHPTRTDEKFIKVDRVDLSVSFISLFSGDKPSIKIDIDSPELIYVTDKRGNWELKEQVPLFRRGKGEKRLPLNVERITISDGYLEFRDGKVGKTTELSDIDIDVKRVQLPTEGDPLPAKFDMSFKIDGSAKLNMKGRADFLSPKISFDSHISLVRLPLPPFAPYYDRRSMPVRITRGSLAMTSHAKCTKDYLRAPAHMTLSRLNVEPKKRSIKGFAADRVVEGIKSRDGRLELDVMISGNIRSPNFHVANAFSKAFAGGFAKGMAEVARDVPGKVGEVGKDIGSKIKGLFGK